jgi:predicted protein tyrosine phosphatase
MIRKNVLFVCGRNQKRSPTAEKIFRDDQRFSVRSVGTSDSSRRKIQQADLTWSDLILVMERKYEDRIKSRFSECGAFPPFYSLDIPDDYEFMDQELIDLLIPAVEHAIHDHNTEPGAAANALRR